MRDFTALAPEVTFPEIDPPVMDAVDAMLARLSAAQWGEAACVGRRLVQATLDGNVETRRHLRLCERLLNRAGY